VSLETYFVQGSYQKILTQKQNVPQPEYNFFIDKFLDAIRYEIARSAECSYDSLSLKDMMQMFMIGSEQELMQFIRSNNPENPEVEWTVRGDRLHFTKSKKEAAEIPNNKMIGLTLAYATELNRIV
jgi:26S proteasome regulatory subunit N12